MAEARGGYFISGVLGIAAGIGAYAVYDTDSRQFARDQWENRDREDTELTASAPDVQVSHLSAFAVGRITGVVTVEADYNITRWGPIPNCDLDTSIDFPFVAEPIVEIEDLEIVPSAPDSNGMYDLTATLQGDIEVLNPRSILTDIDLQMDDGGFFSVCGEDPYNKLFFGIFQVAGLATRTAAECLVNSVNTEYAADLNGNQVQTDASQQIHDIYESDLEEALRALYPDARNIIVNFPDPDPNYDVTRSESYSELADAINVINDDKIEVNADAIKTCTFESLELDVGTVAREN